MCKVWRTGFFVLLFESNLTHCWNLNITTINEFHGKLNRGELKKNNLFKLINLVLEFKLKNAAEWKMLGFCTRKNVTEIKL